MTRGHDPRRLPKQLIVLGLITLFVAFGLTAPSCEQDGSGRAANVALAAIACAGSPGAGISQPPVYYLIFSKLFWLWVLDAGTLVVGVGLAVRGWRGK